MALSKPTGSGRASSSMSTTRWEKGRSHDLRPSSIRRSLADERRGFFQVSRKKNAVQRLDFPGDKGIGQRLNGKASTTGYRHMYGLEEGKKTSDFNIDSIKYTNTAKKFRRAPACKKPNEIALLRVDIGAPLFRNVHRKALPRLRHAPMYATRHRGFDGDT